MTDERILFKQVRTVWGPPYTGGPGQTALLSPLSAALVQQITYLKVASVRWIIYNETEGLAHSCTVYSPHSKILEKHLHQLLLDHLIRPGKLDLLFRISHLLDLHAGGRLLFITHC